jgi:hypothetical protein
MLRTTPNVDSMDPSFQNQNPNAPTNGASSAPANDSPSPNLGTVADIDGKISEFGVAYTGVAIDSGVPSETTPAVKPSWKDRIIHEIKEVGLVMGYLATSFCIIQTFRCATILQKCSENDFLTSYGTACVGAVVLGKFVFVIEKMRIAKHFEHRPLIWAVLYKTVLFTVLVNFLLHFEERLLHKDASAQAATAASPSDPTTFALCFFAHQLAFFVTFLVFFCIRDIARVLGQGRLRRMFFVSID